METNQQQLKELTPEGKEALKKTETYVLKEFWLGVKSFVSIFDWTETVKNKKQIKK